MPNIEIHGLPSSGEGGAHDLRHKIFFAFKDESYLDEMVVTVFYNLVYMSSGRRLPFIRVVNSCQEHTEEIIEKLKQFGIDIEHAKLEAFYPTEDRNNIYHDAAMEERPK